MPKPSNALVRSYALEMLADVKEHPHMNKEQLFTDAMAFFRWRLTDKEEAEESLELYMHEFRMLHQQVVSKLSLELWSACFITWFVEKGFHKLPPLTGFNPADSMMMNTRFSSPSFRLPTGEPTKTYLIQWILWHLDNLPMEMAPGHTQVYRWSIDLLETLPMDEFRMSDALLHQVIRFFSWAREHLHTWAAFTEHQMAFLYSQPGSSCEVLADSCVDLHFIQWYVKTVLDQRSQDQQYNQ